VLCCIYCGMNITAVLHCPLLGPGHHLTWALDTPSLPPAHLLLPAWSSLERTLTHSCTWPPLCHQAQYRGYFIPPRPEKNAVEGQRMSDAFVEERRAGLERYLRRLAAHPVVGTSEVRHRTAQRAQRTECVYL
jgi:PX domain